MTTFPPDVPLQAVLDALDPGAVVHLEPGTYRLDAPLRLQRGVRLAGAGAAATRIVRPRTPHAHVAAARVPGCEELVLEDLTLGWDDGHADAPGAYLFASDVLVVESGRVALRRCHLLGSAAEHRKANDMYGGDGLRATGEAEVRAEECEIRDHGGHGVVVRQRAKASLDACWVAGNRGMGLLAVDEAAPEVRATTFTENERGGVAAFDDAALAIQDATIQANRRFGVRLETRRRLRLDGCAIEANGGPGILIMMGEAAVAGGAIRGNADDGVRIAGGVAATARDVVIAENRGFGVALGPGAAFEMAGVAIYGNGRGDVDRG